MKQFKNREIALKTLNRTIKILLIGKSDQQAQENKTNKKINHSAETEPHQ